MSAAADYALRLGQLRGAVRGALSLLDEAKGGACPNEARKVLAKALAAEDARESSEQAFAVARVGVQA